MPIDLILAACLLAAEPELPPIRAPELPPPVSAPAEPANRPSDEELDRIYDELARVLAIMARKGFGLHE